MKRFAAFALLILLALTQVIANTNTAVAAPPALPEWATWELQVEFDQNEIIGLWHITIGTDLAGTPTPLMVKTIELKCWAVGDVDLLPGYAEIENGGHVNCNLLDFSKTVDAIISAEFGPAHVLNLPSTCNCSEMTKSPVTVQAKASFDITGDHPIFEHPNFNYMLSTELDKSPYMQHNLTVNGLLGDSLSYNTPAGLHEYRSEYYCTPAKCVFDHLFNNMSFDTEVVPHNQLWISNDATTVIIGQGMTGKLHNLYVDPGCYIG